jgi:hypothetical protein
MMFRPLLGLTLAVVAAPAFAAGPETVKPIQAVTQEFGGKYVLAYYTRDDQRCGLVVTTDNDPGPRVRVTLAPEQTATIEDAGGGAMALTCGAAGAQMTVERRPGLLKSASAE